MRPRVLHVGKFFAPDVGGIETYLASLCRALARDWDVRILVATRGRRRIEEAIDGLPVVRVPARVWLSSAPLCPGLAREIARAQPDLVHLHLPHPGGLVGLLASGCRAPLVVTWHSDVVRQRVRALPFRPLERAVLRRAGIVIATGAENASPALRAVGAKVAIVPFGIDLDRFERVDADAVARLRARFGSRLVLAVGRLVYYKGFDVLVDAMARVDGTLVIVGSGPLHERLERRARQAGLAGRVHFAGRVPDDELAAFYHAAQVVVLPSVAPTEAFGIVQLEAMACGTPVVNTALPTSAPRVSLDGVTGLTVPPGDPGALASAIARLLDDEALRARLGEAGRRRVRERFPLEAMVAATDRIYRRVLEASRTVPPFAPVSGAEPRLAAAGLAAGRGPAARAVGTDPSRCTPALVTPVLPRADSAERCTHAAGRSAASAFESRRGFLARADAAAKRALDVALAGAGLLASAPVWLLAALAVKLEDGGPVFYRQPRVGRGGRIFTALKFRSMIPGAEAATGAIQAAPDDPRVTRVGRLLRATALDELPQLWNIFRGEMSFVGPRALRPEEIERPGGALEPLEAVPGYAERVSVTPGLTGLAQIYLPRDVSRRRKFRVDRLYIRRRTLWLDLKLIALSFWISLRGAWEARERKF
jgi:rhamnosyl/mannosyltransferase